MYYSFIIFYFLTCFLYFSILSINSRIVDKIYQNATSKNRLNIKKIKSLIDARKKFYAILLWPLCEIYLKIFSDEWRHITFGLFNAKTF